MSGYVLIIDNQNSVEPVVELALDDTGLSVFRVGDAPSAKRRIVQDAPLLIICSLTINGDHEFGFRFCQELSGHGSFSQIPVMLLCERIDGSVVERATTSGARGMIPWPADSDALRLRLAPVLPQLAEQKAREREVRSEQPNSSVPGTPRAASAEVIQPDPPAEPALAGDTESKFRLAQQLLAKVLHSLKTSNLLEVIEEDEVPSVLMEMTKKVIGEYRPAGSEVEKSGSPAKSTSIDDVFRKKQ